MLFLFSTFVSTSRSQVKVRICFIFLLFLGPKKNWVYGYTNVSKAKNIISVTHNQNCYAITGWEDHFRIFQVHRAILKQPSHPIQIPNINVFVSSVYFGGCYLCYRPYSQCTLLCFVFYFSFISLMNRQYLNFGVNLCFDKREMSGNVRNAIIRKRIGCQLNWRNTLRYS